MARNYISRMFNFKISLQEAHGRHTTSIRTDFGAKLDELGEYSLYPESGLMAMIVWLDGHDCLA
jgi:hypothetical protein